MFTLIHSLDETLQVCRSWTSQKLLPNRPSMWLRVRWRGVLTVMRKYFTAYQFGLKASYHTNNNHWTISPMERESRSLTKIVEVSLADSKKLSMRRINSLHSVGP
jgi:hypothetical protein